MVESYGGNARSHLIFGVFPYSAFDENPHLWARCWILDPQGVEELSLHNAQLPLNVLSQVASAKLFVSRAAQASLNLVQTTTKANRDQEALYSKG
eukprot:2606019-Amphidinium_carterae.2